MDVFQGMEDLVQTEEMAESVIMNLEQTMLLGLMLK